MVRNERLLDPTPTGDVPVTTAAPTVAAALDDSIETGADPDAVRISSAADDDPTPTGDVPVTAGVEGVDDPASPGAVCPGSARPGYAGAAPLLESPGIA
ncbi:hypothetical protein GCM10028802_42380 [Terrabacter terrigena]